MTPRLPIALAAFLLSSVAIAQNAMAQSGAGCASEIATYRAVTDSDGGTGNLARSVYNQVKKEIAAAEAACAAGHDAEASADILASRKRHGYPTNL